MLLPPKKWYTISFFNIYTFKSCRKNNFFANLLVPNCSYFNSMLLEMFYNSINDRNMVRTIKPSI